MITFITVVVALIIGYSTGYNKKSEKTEKMIAELLIEVEEKKEYFNTVEGILEDENDDLKMILDYLEKNKGKDMDAEIVLHKLMTLLEKIDQVKEQQFVSQQAREKIKGMVRTERKEPFIVHLGKKFISWL